MFSGINDHVPEPEEKHPLFFGISMGVLSVLTVLVIWLGVFPDGVISFVQQFRLR